MNKFYNGYQVTKENLFKLFQEILGDNSSLDARTEKAFQMFLLGYEGVDEDIIYVLEELNSIHGAGIFKGSWMHPNPNLETIENIIGRGRWNFENALEEVMTTSEAAEFTGLSEITIKRNCQDGKYGDGARKAGRPWLILRSTLEEAHKPTQG